ncbi:unnamed protein product [Allacma fusca]|uniref:Uncharacterized protein n=1 Tax=Allacma fusca TaxID=39272 RepID=A0A8J2K7M4_9HEXA|nr:unnamed protein product [Allacma fusca]
MIDVPEKRLANKDRDFVDVPAASTSNPRSAIKTAEVGNRLLEEPPKNWEEEVHQLKKLVSNLRRSKIASELKMTEKLRKAKDEALEESKKKYKEIIDNNRLRADRNWKELSSKLDETKKQLEETKESKAQLEEQNEKLKIELGLLPRHYLFSQDYIREFEAVVDLNHKRIAEFKSCPGLLIKPSETGSFLSTTDSSTSSNTSSEKDTKMYPDYSESDAENS